MDRYNPRRDITPAFLDTVGRWIQMSGEVLVILRYLRAAGAKDFALCHTLNEFRMLVDAVPAGTDIEVFRDMQLSMRGTVDEEFIAGALKAIRNDQEFLLLSLDVHPGTRISRYGAIDESHGELRKSLLGLIGEQVAVGSCPPYCVADHESLISAAKSGIDGPR